MLSLEAVQKRIKELNQDHFMFGGWHNWFGRCPHCETVQKLKQMEKIYLENDIP